MNREEIAVQEIGQTDIGGRNAGILVFLFLLTILLVPCIQISSWVVAGMPKDVEKQFPMLRAALLPLRAVQGISEAHGTLWNRLSAGNRVMLSEIQGIESDLKEVSVVGNSIRPPVQYALMRLGWGNEKVLLGSSGWLFFKTAVDSLTGAPFLDQEAEARRVRGTASWETPPTPDPIPAIQEFAGQLSERNIELILLPIPVKAGVIPEKLSPKFKAQGILHNSSWNKFLFRLKESNIRIEGVDNILSHDEPTFLKTDTHWRWDAMDAVAQQLSVELRGLKVEATSTFTEKTEKISHQGDLYQMLPMLSPSFFPKEDLDVHPVSRSGASHSEAKASVLLMGDSFSNIYSDPELGWGSRAGLGVRLAFHLQAPVEEIVLNNNGAYATRLELIRRLSRDPSFLDSIRFVIWEFTERELSFGDWRSLELGEKSRETASFVALAQGESRRIHGLIEAMGEIPDPDEAAYPDYLLALHLIDVLPEKAANPSGSSEKREALVFVWAMRDYRLLPGAHHHEGDSISLEIQPWADVSAELGSVTRGEIFDQRLLAQAPCWGEEISQ